ncbi:MAG: F0F1 ATP synthase subunit gamma [Alphaproteobacteria bacterium]
MERLALLTRRIHSLSDLHGVVGALRGLAAARRQQAAEALAGAHLFAEVVGQALAEALALLPGDAPSSLSTPSSPAVLLFGAENGFVGAFNEVLLDKARAVTGGGPLLVVGSRCAVKAAERGQPPAWTTAMTSHRAGVPALARRIAEALYQRFADGHLTGLVMVYARSSGGSQWSAEMERLLPLDPRRLPPAGGPPPLLTLDARSLVDALIGEYLFALLAQAAMDSLVAENAARFAAMEAARQNIERRLDDLNRAAHRLRQEDITTELLDVVTGAEAAASPLLCRRAE